jgi:hypothetical protein
MKQYIGIARDHSGSMSRLTKAAMNDYNLNVESIQTAAKKHNIETIVSVVEFGNPQVNRVITNSPIDKLKPITHYDAVGGTPMLDAVGDLVTQFMSVPDAHDPNISFLIMVVTDGDENQSRVWNWNYAVRRIQELQNTNRWTFTFRIPKGYYKDQMIGRGLPAENILEWETTEKGMEEASVQTQNATSNFYEGRSRGVTATRNFYANLNDVKPQDVRNDLVAITAKCKVWSVKKADQIKAFCEKNLPKKEDWVKGAAFYQLTKSESVQAYKKFLIRTKKSGAIYGGYDARQMLGLPKDKEVKLVPGDHGEFDIFVQSTSVNRKLVPGTEVIYCVEAS